MQLAFVPTNAAGDLDHQVEVLASVIADPHGRVMVLLTREEFMRLNLLIAKGEPGMMTAPGEHPPAASLGIFVLDRDEQARLIGALAADEAIDIANVRVIGSPVIHEPSADERAAN